MARVLQPKSSSTALSDTPSTVSNANRVLIQHNHASGNSHEVILKNSDGDVLGSILCHPSADQIIEKYKTDTLEVGSSISDVFATSIGVIG